jgi:hypothetical protein
MRRAASSMPARSVTGTPASASASGKFGVTTRASGKMRAMRAWRASSRRSGSPDFATITGSTTRFAMGRSRSTSAMASMIGRGREHAALGRIGAEVIQHRAELLGHERGRKIFHALHGRRSFGPSPAVITEVPNTPERREGLDVGLDARPHRRESDPAMVRARGIRAWRSSIRMARPRRQRFADADLARLVGGADRHASRVKPSALQRSLPTPWCTKKRPSGSYRSLMARRRGSLAPQYASRHSSSKKLLSET